jgi:hypothetical protein
MSKEPKHMERSLLVCDSISHAYNKTLFEMLYNMFTKSIPPSILHHAHTHNSPLHMQVYTLHPFSASSQIPTPFTQAATALPPSYAQGAIPAEGNDIDNQHAVLHGHVLEIRKLHPRPDHKVLGQAGDVGVGETLGGGVAFEVGHGGEEEGCGEQGG